MTYLDLKQKLQYTIQELNLQVEPLEVKQNVQINEIGQVICNDKQMFENGGEPRLIDKKSKMLLKRYDAGSREREGSFLKQNFRLVTDSTMPALKLQLAPEVKSSNALAKAKTSPKSAVPFQNSSQKIINSLNSKTNYRLSNLLSNQFTDVSTHASVRGGSPIFSISRQKMDKENVYGTSKTTAF